MAVDEPFEAHVDRKAAWGVVGGSLLGLATGGWTLLSDWTGPADFTGWPALLGLSFALIVMLAGLVQTVRAGQAIRIDEIGVMLGRRPMPIPWRTIRSAKRVDLGDWAGKWGSSSGQLAFDVDPNVDRPWLSSLNRLIYRNSHVVGAVGTDQSFDELVWAFNRFAPERLRFDH